MVESRILDPITSDGYFSPSQIEYITNTVASGAIDALGEKLREVILYGSYARGDFHEWSDVDIMLLLDENDHSVYWKMVNKVRDNLESLIGDMNCLLSLVAISYSDFVRHKNLLPFYNNVDKEGVRVYVC